MIAFPMYEPGTLAEDVRSRTSALIRERQEALATEVSSTIPGDGVALDVEQRRGCAELLLRLFAVAIEGGVLDSHSPAMRGLTRYSPPLTTRQLLDVLHLA